MSTEVRRALSPSERWYWIADQVSPLNVVARVHLHGKLEPAVLQRAAVALTAEHPLLRVAIAADADGRNPAFVTSTRTCPVRSVSGDELEWERQVDDRELATSLDWRTGPLVRIVHTVLDSGSGSGSGEHDVVLTVSHIIADGTTALALLQRLLEHADRVSTAESTTSTMAPAGSRPVIGAPESLLPTHYRGAQGVARIVGSGLADVLAGALGARPSRLGRDPAGPPGPLRTRLVRQTLTAVQVDSLSRRCRQNGVTVHGALAAAMAITIGPLAANRDSGRICIGSPIDLRADLSPPVPPDEAGAYVCTVPSMVRFGPRADLWSTARQINRSLSRRKRIEQHFALLAALRFMSPTSVAKSPRTFALLERLGPGNVCISNLGRYDFTDRIGGWLLSGAQFISGVSVSGYLAATVNTSHGELFWNFNYIDAALSKDAAQQIADGCVQTLLHALTEEGAMSSLKTAPPPSKSVLITGASSGLGRAAAIRLAALGYRVYAGVRTDAAAADLTAASPPAGEIIPVLLDVTDAASITRTAERVQRDCGSAGLYAVVNNAGVSISAPLECIPIETVRSELETNLIGAIAVTQQFLPLLRASKGRIVNVSSGVGSIAPPYLSIYAASQFAKEGLSDALRRELQPLGVSVSVIQPGAVHTPIWGKMEQSAAEILAAAPAEVVDAYRTRFLAFMNMNAARAQESKTTPEDYADAVATALSAKRPKARYRVGLDSWSSAFARRVLPDPVIDTVLAVGVKTMTRSAAADRTEVRR